MQQCHTPSRNFCVGTDQVAALFVDIDGTAIECQKYFDEAHAAFAHIMKLRGFDPEEAEKRLSEIDHAKTEAEGFERDRFGKSLVECYREMIAKGRRRISAEHQHLDEVVLTAIGSIPFFREPVLFRKALPVLARAHKTFTIFAVTIGDREAQKFKIRQAGLDPVFDDLIITPSDNKLERVREAIEDYHINPHLSAFIGNSIRSDGSCLAATNFIWLPLEGGWAFDKSKALPENTGFTMYSVKTWLEAEERGINRLLRHRKSFVAASQDKRKCGHGQHKPQ